MLMLLAAAGYQYSRTPPSTTAYSLLPTTETIGALPAMPWPASGAAALFVEGIGQLGASGGQTPIPMASTAKMMTALLVLEDHPLALGEAGPLITITRADVSTYISERSQNESVVPVVLGEQLSEYQLLEGLLLPSASNFADLLATWDVGTVAAFIARMNARAGALGMNHTHYADASGFSASSVSIPSDLIALAQTTMQVPVFAQIVSQSQATIPVAGVIKNLDTLLGRDGVIGIKTGHTDKAGGCFVVAANFLTDGQLVRVYGAVMGQPNALAGAFAATDPLLRALEPALQLRMVVKPHDAVAEYETAWNEFGTIVAEDPVSWVLIDGTPISRRVTLIELPRVLPAGSRVGTLVVDAGIHHAEVPLVTTAAISGPSLGWRLTRGF